VNDQPHAYQYCDYIYGVINLSAADIKEDIKAEDCGEPVSLMEPLLITDSSRHRSILTDLAIDPTQRSSGFRRSLPPALLASLVDLVSIHELL
jgi:hypothetical protein